ncbi:LANO_0G06502g1_1 [Lachancea nothofagi CBS 11611]|uniref:RING-type E3 ubiquitin transferase n=1 Tax=Lachancea nothofagi CBS 11611 TaxID=1266666 RepID=A0A1G4KH64_9SACH|nr:LANO_0G06502g1_1 [Lachancea nothofagi CBS 11611]
MPGPEFVNSFAEWQTDDLVHNCLNCQTKFTFMVRKHHCRCCGGIFCANCSDKFLWYNKRKVKVVRRKDEFEAIEFPPHRTCASCYENLTEMHLVVTKWGDKRGLQAVSSGATARSNRGSGIGERNSELTNSLPTSSSASSFQANEVAKKSIVADTPGEVDLDANRCPICNADLSKVAEPLSIEHIQKCVHNAEMTQQHHKQQQGTSSSANNPFLQNRMLVYVIQPSSIVPPLSSTLECPECPICFEEMRDGDKVGRLECLCVFHYDCIKSWFKKKSQKVKASSAKCASKNFCPLHDAVF